MTRDDDSAMEKLIEELGYQIPFKDTTETGDTVIMLREDDDGRVSMVYAQVLGFDRDTTKRDEWWHVHFVFMEVPPLPRTIILQTAHFTGQEVFTMGGRKVFIKAINFQAFADDIFVNPDLEKKNRKEKKTETENTGRKPTFTLVK